MESVSLAVAFLGGLLSFLSPCVLPLVPVYLGIITGMSLEELQASASRRAILIPALWFIAGFSFVFMLMGASATLIGQLFRMYQDWIARIGGIIVVIFGLHLLGAFRIAPLMREKRLQLAGTPRGYLGAAATGVAFGAGWTPCIGPVLGGVMSLAMIRETMWSGLLLLGVYSLGLAVPFLLAGLATGTFLAASRRFRGFLPVVEKASGAVLLVVGVMLLTGTFTALAAFFTRLTPDFLLKRL